MWVIFAAGIMYTVFPILLQYSVCDCCQIVCYFVGILDVSLSLCESGSHFSLFSMSVVSLPVAVLVYTHTHANTAYLLVMMIGKAQTHH